MVSFARGSRLAALFWGLRLDLEVFHVGEERAPHHAGETRAHHLILGRHEREVQRLHRRPINHADFVCVEEFRSDLFVPFRSPAAERNQRMQNANGGRKKSETSRDYKKKMIPRAALVMSSRQPSRCTSPRLSLPPLCVPPTATLRTETHKSMPGRT